jgi:hypothetical protein
MSKPNRIETGPIRFDDDWPGVFIRGDNAFYFAACLRDVLAAGTPPLRPGTPDSDVNIDMSAPMTMYAISYSVVEDLQRLLESCLVKDGEYPKDLTNIARWVQLPSRPKT